MKASKTIFVPVDPALNQVEQKKKVPKKTKDAKNADSKKDRE